jgi:hypothetical protein
MASDNSIISILIQAKDNASSTLKDVSSQITQTGNASDEAEPKAGRFGTTLDTLGSRVRFVAETFAIYKVGGLITDFAENAVSAAGQLEQTNMSFQSLIGNTKEANELLAFGQTAGDVITTVKQLGDVTSAGGGDLQALSVVTGQIFAQGKLRAQDMYQVINDGGAGLVKIMATNAGGMQKLTDEFETGGIPAQQYFDAVNQATSKGGFAFQGALAQASTFNGRLSTLKDSATQFGEALIGVHTDPELGLQIAPGGLFDLMKGAIQGVSDTLSGWEPTAQRVIPLVIGRVKEAGTEFLNTAAQVANWHLWMGKAHDVMMIFADDAKTVLSVAISDARIAFEKLLPDLITLKNTFFNDLVPALERLWNTAKPLVYTLLKDAALAFGATLFAAIWLTINALNTLLQVVTPVIDYLADHKGVLDALVGSFLLLRGAMMLQDAFAAIQVGAIVLTNITFPSVMASITAMTAAWSTAFPIAGILADIGLVIDMIKTGIDTLHTLDNTAAAATADAQGQAAAEQTVINDYKAGKITKADETRILTFMANGQHALGTNFAGSDSYLAGEDGPELIVGGKGSRVIPARQTAQMMGSGRASIQNVTVNNYASTDLNALIRKIGFKLATA